MCDFVIISFIFNACLDHVCHLLDQPMFVFVDLVVDGMRLRLMAFGLCVVCLVLCFVLFVVGCAPAP